MMFPFACAESAPPPEGLADPCSPNDHHEIASVAELGTKVQVLIEGQQRMEVLLATLVARDPCGACKHPASEGCDQGPHVLATPTEKSAYQMYQSSDSRDQLAVTRSEDEICAYESRGSKVVEFQLESSPSNAHGATRAATWRSRDSNRNPDVMSAGSAGSASEETFGCQDFQVRPDFQGGWERLDGLCRQLLAVVAQGGGGDESDDFLCQSSDLEFGMLGSRALSPSFLERSREPTCVLSPSSTPRLLLDMASIVVLLYDLLTLPYLVAFSIPQEGYFLYLGAVSLSFWAMDILVTFRTGIYEHGELRMQPKTICHHYLRTTFALDVGLVALDAMALGITLAYTANASAPDAFKIGRLVKITRLVRCLTVVRVRRISDAFDRVSRGELALQATTTMLVDVAKFMSVILWLNHVIACTWIFLGRSGPFDTGYSWLDTPTGLGAQAHTYKDTGNLYQYATAMHWALTQMTPGSMQVFPANSTERVFNMVCLISGMLGFSTLISSLSASVTQFKLNMASRSAKLQALNRFLKYYNVNSRLAMQVRKQIAERLRDKRPLVVKDVKVLDMLSVSLRSSLETEICRPHLQYHMFFNLLLESDEAAAKDLCVTCTRFSILLKGEDLFLSGVEAVGMHFLTKGGLAYILDTSSLPLEHTMSSFRGSTATSTGFRLVEAGQWLSEAALWLLWRHVGRAENRSPDTCEVLTLIARELGILLRRRGGILEQLGWAYAQNFCKLMVDSQRASARGVSSMATDMKLMFETEKVFATMPLEAKKVLSYNTIRVLHSYNSGWLTSLDKFRLQNQLSSEAISELEREADEGGSVLLLVASNSNGVLRVATQVSLWLTRADRALLVLLRSDRQADGHLKASCRLGCRLPTVEAVGSESPQETVERLLLGQLSSLREGVTFLGAKPSQSTRSPGERGVSTWSACTKVFAQWHDHTDDDECQDTRALELDDIDDRSPDWQDSQNFRGFSEAYWKLFRSKTGSFSLGSNNSDGSGASEHTTASHTEQHWDKTAAEEMNTQAASPGHIPTGQLFKLPDGTLAAWMTQQDYKLLSSTKGGAGQRVLKRWMATASVSADDGGGPPRRRWYAGQAAVGKAPTV